MSKYFDTVIIPHAIINTTDLFMNLAFVLHNDIIPYEDIRREIT